VAGATVHVRVAGEAPREIGRTDASGGIDLATPAQPATVVVVADGYATGIVEVRPGAREVRVALADGGSLRGRVELGDALSAFARIRAGEPREIRIVVGPAYGLAARLVEPGGSPLRFSPWIETIDDRHAFVGVGGFGESRPLFDTSPELALLGLDVASIHERLPEPKSVWSSFVATRGPREPSIRRTVSIGSLGYRTVRREVTLSPVEGGVRWIEVALEPEAALAVGSLELAIDGPAWLHGASDNRVTPLGHVELREIARKIDLAISVRAIGEPVRVDGVPAALYDVRFVSADERTTVPDSRDPAERVEISGDTASRVELDLHGLGAVEVRILDEQGDAYDRLALLRVAPTGARARAGGSTSRASAGRPTCSPRSRPGATA